jgi:hypothetical protein
MDSASISRTILELYPGVVETAAWGEQSFFYNPGKQLPRGVYFATLKHKDGANDKASQLDRPDTYRLNLGVSKSTYSGLFGEPPARPSAGGIVATGHDFTEHNRLLPHPVYGWMSWICVLNPNPETFTACRPLLDEAYQLAVAKFDRRTR